MAVVKRKQGQALPVAWIVEGIETHGGRFVIRNGGTLYVEGLGRVPVELREQFFDCDAPALVAFIRGRGVQAASPGQAEAALGVSTVGQG